MQSIHVPAQTLSVCSTTVELAEETNTVNTAAINAKTVKGGLREAGLRNCARQWNANQNNLKIIVDCIPSMYITFEIN
jgi:hypothetical protein